MAKEADMILSEFILLGIGGKELSEENAAQTAKALNIIQPDFIRVHATGIKPESKLGEFVRNGSFCSAIGGRNRCRAKAILTTAT